MVSHRPPGTRITADNQPPGAVGRLSDTETQARKVEVLPLVGCETKPVAHTLAGRETLDLDGSVRRKVHNGKHRVVDILEQSAGAGGTDTK